MGSLCQTILTQKHVGQLQSKVSIRKIFTLYFNETINLRIFSGCWQAWAGYVVGYELMSYILSVTVSKVLMHIHILETVKPFRFSIDYVRSASEL